MIAFKCKYTCACMSVCTQACGGHRFLHCTPHVDRVSHCTVAQPFDKINGVSQPQTSLCHCLPCVGIAGGCHYAWLFSVGAGFPNWSSHVWTCWLSPLPPSICLNYSASDNLNRWIWFYIDNHLVTVSFVTLLVTLNFHVLMSQWPPSFQTVFFLLVTRVFFCCWIPLPFWPSAAFCHSCCWLQPCFTPLSPTICWDLVDLRHRIQCRRSSTWRIPMKTSWLHSPIVSIHAWDSSPSSSPLIAPQRHCLSSGSLQTEKCVLIEFT